MSVNWFSGGRCYDVGYDGDVMRAEIYVNQWQSPEAFEAELLEAMKAARVRLVEKQKELHASSIDEETN